MTTESASSDLEMTSQVEDSDGGATEESLPSTSVSSETGESSDSKEERKTVQDIGRLKLSIEVNNSLDFTDVTDLSNLDEMSFLDRKNSSKSQNLDDFTDSKCKIPVPDFTALAGEWYRHECFQRYWDHYHQVMAWCGKHNKTYNEVTGKTAQKSPYDHMQQGYTLPGRSPWQHPYVQSYPWQHSSWQVGYAVPEQTKGDCSCGQSKQSIKRRRKQRLRRQRKSSVSSESLSQTDGIANSEEFEMEITEDMVEFFAKSEEHRKQREEEKRGAHESGKAEPQRINVEEVKATNQKGPTVEAPKERPGARRTSEMKLLYGTGAAMIHGMETAVQMTYDRNMDIKQPKVWPNMPLKLVFG